MLGNTPPLSFAQLFASSHVHCVSRKRPTFTTCYNFYIHSSIATIFGINVAEKVGNKNLLHFPTISNQCFCTTWGNRKPGNCVFSLKCCMLFHQKHETQLKISPGQSLTTIHCQNDRVGAPDRTQEGSITSCCVLPTCSVLAMCHAVSRCVKDGSCSSSSLE